jgi:hypothetical protein
MRLRYSHLEYRDPTHVLANDKRVERWETRRWNIKVVIYRRDRSGFWIHSISFRRKAWTESEARGLCIAMQVALLGLVLVLEDVDYKRLVKIPAS